MGNVWGTHRERQNRTGQRTQSDANTDTQMNDYQRERGVESYRLLLTSGHLSEQQRRLLLLFSCYVTSDSSALLMDCSLPGSSVHGIFPARILEWVAIPSPGDLPAPGIEPESPACVSFIAGEFFSTEPARKSSRD